MKSISCFLKSTSKYFSIIFILALMFGAGGCSEDDSPTDTNNNKPGSNEIFMQNTAFAPGNLTISVGTTIKWINKDSFAHTVTSGEPGAETSVFDSGNLGQNGEFSFTFTQAGTFEYFCKLHPTMMQATIIVQ